MKQKLAAHRDNNIDIEVSDGCGFHLASFHWRLIVDAY
jgi:hypothetical protein